MLKNIGKQQIEENFKDEIIYELDMIRILSRLSTCAINNDSDDSKNDSLELIFDDIEKRCWKISEYIEKFNLA